MKKIFSPFFIQHRPRLFFFSHLPNPSVSVWRLLFYLFIYFFVESAISSYDCISYEKIRFSSLLNYREMELICYHKVNWRLLITFFFTSRPSIVAKRRKKLLESLKIVSRSRSHRTTRSVVLILSSWEARKKKTIPTSKYDFDSKKLNVLFSVIIDEVLETFNSSAPTCNNKYIHKPSLSSVSWLRFSELIKLISLDKFDELL